MKKTYMMPSIEATEVLIDSLMAASASTTLDPTKDNQEVKPDDEEYDGPFSGNRGGSSWDDED